VAESQPRDDHDAQRFLRRGRREHGVHGEIGKLAKFDFAVVARRTSSLSCGLVVAQSYCRPVLRAKASIASLGQVGWSIFGSADVEIRAN
jgi:hypothetical protein